MDLLGAHHNAELRAAKAQAQLELVPSPRQAGVELNTLYIGTARRDRTQTRQQAACAIQLAARSLAVEPAALSAAAYRAFCAGQEKSGLPSSLAISVLFVGWQRACEHVAMLTHDDAEVEADVIRTLYGDTSSRHRTYATCGHDHTAELLGAAPDRSHA